LQLRENLDQLLRGPSKRIHCEELLGRIREENIAAGAKGKEKNPKSVNLLVDREEISSHTAPQTNKQRSYCSYTS
jgi:hypothetical protein